MCGKKTCSLGRGWRLALVLHAKARDRTELLKSLQLVKAAKVTGMEEPKI